MEKIITYETLRNFAYVNDGICGRPIRGIVLFFGLNGRDMYSDDTPDGQYFARLGILYVVPYNNPWAWMNRQAVSYTDEILDVLFAQYDLPGDLPVVSTGGSMGGLSALVYTKYARRTPVACVANCPVCDLPYHFTERPDLPRTLYSAFWNYEGTLDEALRLSAPSGGGDAGRGIHRVPLRRGQGGEQRDAQRPLRRTNAEASPRHLHRSPRPRTLRSSSRGERTLPRRRRGRHTPLNPPFPINPIKRKDKAT